MILPFQNKDHFIMHKKESSTIANIA